MPAIELSLVQSAIAKIKRPSEGRQLYRDKALKTFALEVLAGGTCTFYRVGRVLGQVTRIKLGNWPEIPADLARELCIKINGDIASGIDPRRKKRQPVSTLGDVWKWYYEHHALPRKRTADRDLSVWNRVLSRWDSWPLGDITRAMIIELQTELRQPAGRATTGQRKGGPGAANEALSLLRGLYDTANANGWHSGNPTVGVPREDRHSRDRFLQPDEMPQFFEQLNKLTPTARDVLKLALFTGVRRSNVCAARWDQINLATAVWIIPHDQSKNKSPMHVTLTREAMEILLSRANNGSEWVFPSRGKTGHFVDPSRQWEALLQRSGLTNLRIHDLRRTLASWQAGAGVPLHVIGKSLGHQSTSATGIYARLQDGIVREAVDSAAKRITEAATKKNPKNAQNS